MVESHTTENGVLAQMEPIDLLWRNLEFDKGTVNAGHDPHNGFAGLDHAADGVAVRWKTVDDLQLDFGNPAFAWAIVAISAPLSPSSRPGSRSRLVNRLNRTRFLSHGTRTPFSSWPIQSISFTLALPVAGRTAYLKLLLFAVHHMPHVGVVDPCQQLRWKRELRPAVAFGLVADLARRKFIQRLGDDRPASPALRFVEARQHIVLPDAIAIVGPQFTDHAPVGG